MKRILTVFLILFIIIMPLSSCETVENKGFLVVATNFPSYDFAKNIIGDMGSVELLLPPGGESHTYEPTAKDIVKISECDVFIYTGSESDAWVEKILSSLSKKPAVIRLTDFVTLCKTEHEEHEEHKGHSHEFDEHVWTSLKNSKKIVEGIADRFCEINPDFADSFKKNAIEYIEEIDALDRDFEELFESAARHTIVVADRFPFTYFVRDYNLSYYAAYHSCSEDAEPTPAVMAELIDAVKTEEIPVVFYIEFSNKAVCTAVSEDTGAKARLLHSCHSVTKEQLENNIRYIDLMLNNYEALKEAVCK